MKILVLEVDEKDRFITNTLLKDHRHSLIVLVNPFDLFRILKKETFDLIFIPLEIEGVDAMKLCQRIKQFHPQAINYAFSSQLQVYDTALLEAAGFDGFLKWPAKPETLETAIEGAAFRLAKLSNRQPAALNA